MITIRTTIIIIKIGTYTYLQRLIAADIPQRLRAPTADASEGKWSGSVSQFETQPGGEEVFHNFKHNQVCEHLDSFTLAAQFPQQTFANGSIDDGC